MMYKLFGVFCISIALVAGSFCLKTFFGLINKVVKAPSLDFYLLGMLTFSLFSSLLLGFAAYFLYKFGKKLMDSN